MIFICVVPFESEEKKIPDLSLPPCKFKHCCVEKYRTQSTVGDDSKQTFVAEFLRIFLRQERRRLPPRRPPLPPPPRRRSPRRRRTTTWDSVSSTRISVSSIRISVSSTGISVSSTRTSSTTSTRSSRLSTSALRGLSYPHFLKTNMSNFLYLALCVFTT
jgi:hypothetical protein